MRCVRTLRSVAALVGVSLTGAASCSSPTASCDRASAVAGQWTYMATRESPVAGTISGSLTLTSVNCVDLQGMMDVVETLTTGETRRMAGPVSGTVVDSTLVRFEAALGNGGGSREHFARVIGDSLAGTWVETSGGPSGAGPFSGRREQ